MRHPKTTVLASAGLGTLVALAVNLIPMSGDLALAIAGLALVAGVAATLHLDGRHTPRPDVGSSVDRRASPSLPSR